MRIAQEIVASGRLEIGYSCIEVAVDAALLESEFGRAAAMLEAASIANRRYRRRSRS